MYCRTIELGLSWGIETIVLSMWKFEKEVTNTKELLTIWNACHKIIVWVHLSFLDGTYSVNHRPIWRKRNVLKHAIWLWWLSYVQYNFHRIPMDTFDDVNGHHWTLVNVVVEALWKPMCLLYSLHHFMIEKVLRGLFKTFCAHKVFVSSFLSLK